MNKFQTLFKMMDESIFQQMERLKSSEVAVQYNQVIQQTTPEVQKLINHSINIVLLIIPISIVSMMGLGNIGLRSEVNTKIEILELINTYSQKQVEVDSQSSLVVSPRIFTKQSDLENNLKQTYSQADIDATKMAIQNFKQDSALKPLLKTEASLAFQSLTMNNLSSLLLALLKDYKMKIAAIDIKLEKIDSTLSGSLSIIHYSKIIK
jgi:hypothetical protein